MMLNPVSSIISLIAIIVVVFLTLYSGLGGYPGVVKTGNCYGFIREIPTQALYGAVYFRYSMY
ncbi:MAG: hypothetical protein LBU25_00885 [Treponema sp.]|jgi:hypothetical protein|nr:hypothetical protein [Treponema sp.]